MNTLSAFRYYGGKAKMAPLICDLLDYEKTDTYIEPFGGGARTLLNKPRHKYEIYNDASAGLCAFMKAMSEPELAQRVIDRLYETEFSEEEFNKALVRRNEVEDNFLAEFKRQTRLFLNRCAKRYNNEIFIALKETLRYDDFPAFDMQYQQDAIKNTLSQADYSLLTHYYNQLKLIYDKVDIKFNELFNICTTQLQKQIASGELFEDVELVTRNKTPKKFDQAEFERAMKKECFKRAIEEVAQNNHDDVDFHLDDPASVVDLAVATFVIYSQSRDGIGKNWSEHNYVSTDAYHGQIDRLHDVAERMEGVEVTNVGALAYLLETNYLNDPTAMFYLDPSYLAPDNDDRSLGDPYKVSSTKENHILLLKTICKADAKILISNYDVDIYNEILTPELNWRKVEFETFTGVGSTKDNRRLEILWLNY